MEREMNSTQRVLEAMQGNRIDHVPAMPITMMLAADQIDSSYRDYVTDHRVLVRGQLAICESFGVDYVSCISDPAREAYDCGAAVSFFDDQPPAIDEGKPLLADKARLGRLEVPDPSQAERMSDRLAAAGLFREQVGGEKAIEGWIEGPCAEAADLRGLNQLMFDFFDDPPFVRDLLEFVTEMELSFARAQIEAGVDFIGVGDAASSLIGPEIFREFILPYHRRYVQELHKMQVPIRLHVCGNITKLLPALGELDYDLVDLDFPVSVAEARENLGEKQNLLGNLDPVRVVRDGDPESIETELDRCWEVAGPRYFVGAGCEIPRGTPAENLRALCDRAELYQG